MLNPNWLHTFVTLIDTGHFTKTAEKLFMTQPGVSQHVRKLEQACGHALIRRDKKSFELTEQGRRVYQYAGQLALNEHELLEQLNFDDPYSGQYSLACSGSLALLLYPLLLDLQSQHPKIVTQLKAAPNHQILTEIQQGTVDIGIVTHIPNPNLFDVQQLGHEQLCLVIPAIADPQTKASQAEKYDAESSAAATNVVALLNDLGLINHPDAEHYLSLYFAQSQEPALTDLIISDIPVSGYVNQISQILLPVAKGLGFTVLPKSAIDSFENSQRLKIVPPQQPVLEPLYMVKKKNRKLPARFDTVNVQLQAHFQDLSFK